MWTATKTEKGRDRTTAWVQATFTDGTSSFERVYRSDSTPDDWPDAEIRSQLDRLNALDLDKITLGAIAPPIPPGPPTQEQLDLQAFQAARLDYLAKKKSVDEGLTKTVTQADVDDAYALMKTLYKEEYGVFL